MTLVAAIAGFDIGGPILLKGLLTGVTYGLLAVGLVLVYQSSKFINFAHVGVGLFGSAVLAKLALDPANEGLAVPYWIAMIAAVLVGAGAAMVTEVVVVRPLSSAPKVLAMVATLGMAGFFLFVALAVIGDGLQPSLFPRPDIFPRFEVGALVVDTHDSAKLFLAPVVLVALGLFLTRTRAGLAIRGAASNPDAATLAGVSPQRMSLLSWGLAGGLAVFSVALLIPSKGTVSPETLGPDLLVRALAAAAIARFSSMSIALAVAVTIGVSEQVLATNPDANGWIEVGIFVALMVSLLATRRSGREETETWEGLGTRSRLPVAYRKIFIVRNLGVITGIVALLAAAAVPFFASNSTSLTATIVIALAIVGLSVSIITGLGGQLSLGQYAIGGIGAAGAIAASEATGSFWLGVIVAMIVAGVVSGLIGLPAFRVRGQFLGVATLSFALVCSGFLFGRDAFFGGGVSATRPEFELFDGSARNYYLVALGALAISMLAARNLRRGAFGRKLEAVRDNPDAARAMSVSATRVTLQAYVVAGMVAGLGATIGTHAFDSISPELLPVQLSVDAVVATVIGGLGSLAGPIIGALYIQGIPALLDITEPQALAALSAIWLVMLTYQPNGFAGVAQGFTSRFVDFIARTRGVDPVEARSYGDTSEEQSLEQSVAVLRERIDPARSGAYIDRSGVPMLSARNITRRFGGLVAVDDVSLDVYPGETVGLIGPNGAGKTTLFEVISGFTPPDVGNVWFEGKNITSLSAHERARIGMARSFQGAQLFPTLTVLDTVMVARERTRRSTAFESILGLGRIDRKREEEALAVMEIFGLTRFSDTPIDTLPTGTRRLVELACTVALDPTLILLDEPSAGIAQSETEELAGVLAGVRDAFNVTFVIIEHDLPMLCDLCDRLIAMEVGAVTTTGTPDQVRNHPRVVESYVGPSLG
jgi:ABC-type branched-subunit amino acid transport system ATPase component/ABC-type branched-subunit amino acid transport system permease subunit